MRRTLTKGFTIIELIMVMLMVSFLAVVALPRLQGSNDFRELGFKDRVAATLRYAQKTAVSHRRLVCAAIGSDQIDLTIANAFPAISCSAGSALPGPDGRTPAASSPTPGSIGITPSATPLHFQPGGTITTSANETSGFTNFTVTITNQSAITLYGSTGHVE